MKISALEFQKDNGQIDLKHLKRKPLNKNDIDEVLKKSGTFTSEQLAKLAKIVAPKHLGPVIEARGAKHVGIMIWDRICQMFMTSIFCIVK